LLRRGREAAASGIAILLVFHQCDRRCRACHDDDEQDNSKRQPSFLTALPLASLDVGLGLVGHIQSDPRRDERGPWLDIVRQGRRGWHRRSVFGGDLLWRGVPWQQAYIRQAKPLAVL